MINVQLKSNEELEIMRRANIVVAEVHALLREAASPGVTTAELDRIARRHLDKRGAKSAFLGYHGFPAVLCTSVNEKVVHGIPSDKEPLRDGDICSIDFGAIVDGYVGDAAQTLAIGKVSERAAKLLEVTRGALGAAIEQCRPGRRLRDVCGAVEEHVTPHGFGVVRDFVGHGIGRKMHEDPQVPNYRVGGRLGALRLEPGLVIAIEPMINEGTFETKTLDDGWTVVTADGKLSAHFEHSVAITRNGPWVLSDPEAIDPR